MKAKAQSHESGQGLILILLALVGLMGLTALAVDGGHVFAARRQAQNAADTASFAAAIANLQVPAPRDPAVVQAALQAAGLARSASNSFADTLNDPAVNTGEPVDVIVNWPPDSTAPRAYVGDLEYVQVKINAQVPTFFARLVGVTSLPIGVQAVAEAIPPHQAPLGGDNGIVALGDVCNAVRTHGNGTTHLTGGGVFSNSSANGTPGDCWSFNAKGTGDQIFAPDATLVGCLDPGDISGGKIHLDIPRVCGASSIPWPPPPPDLGFTCADLPVGTRTGTTAHPGRWSRALGNLGGSGAFPPNPVDTLDPGVYCITGTFIMNASDSLTSTGGVTFILDGHLRWNAGASIDLIPSDDTLYDGKIAGLLIYRPLNDPMCGTPPCQTLEINGGADTNWSGTIFAPDSQCDINGTSDSLSLHAQAICYTVDIGGSSTWTLTYDGRDNWDFPYPGQTELNR